MKKDLILSEEEKKRVAKINENALELTQTKKINKEVITITDKFKLELMNCVNCPILTQCKYPQKRLEVLKKDAKNISEKIYSEEIELDDSAENTLRAQNKRDYVYKTYIENRAFDVLKNDKCIYERKELQNILQKFVDAGYDITDPRASLVINELMGNILNSGRANKTFTGLGVILKKETSNGPVYYENPLLRSKMEFSKIIIESTEALDRMLKSDETHKTDKTFTEHLLNALKIREQKRKKIFDEEIIIDAEFEEPKNDSEEINTETKEENSF